MTVIYPAYLNASLPISLHCEKRSDDAIQSCANSRWIASLRSQ